MKVNLVLVAMLSLVVLVGCAKTDLSTPSPSAEGAKYLLAEEPAEVDGVIHAREAVADGDEVTLVGRIGGSENPWIEGRAAFSIVDTSLMACSDDPADECQTPWDYCCATDKLPAATALVKFVDENGDPQGGDARELLGVRELSTVVIKGKAQRDDANNLTVLATNVYVKKM